MTLRQLLGIDVPVIQAPMAGVQGSALAPYYREFGIDPASIEPGPGRSPFSSDAAEILATFEPAVVSFHFGLPSDDLLARVRAMGATIIASATTVDEARWLESRGGFHSLPCLRDFRLCTGPGAGGARSGRYARRMPTS
jgi:NAD(P)H-dependent flavin oxidoreductase YrpB (nitropropane dioxygenase family)